MARIQLLDGFTIEVDTSVIDSAIDQGLETLEDKTGIDLGLFEAGPVTIKDPRTAVPGTEKPGFFSQFTNQQLWIGGGVAAGSVLLITLFAIKK